MKISYPIVMLPDELIKSRRKEALDILDRSDICIAISYKTGVLFFTRPRMNIRKISDIYNKIAMSGIGDPTDFETIRRTLVTEAAKKAYMYDEKDVSASSLVKFVSIILRDALEQQTRFYRTSIILADICKKENEIFTVDYDGYFEFSKKFLVCGSFSKKEKVSSFLNAKFREGMSLEEIITISKDAFFMSTEAKEGEIEAAILDRTIESEEKFRHLSTKEIESFFR